MHFQYKFLAMEHRNSNGGKGKAKVRAATRREWSESSDRAEGKVRGEKMLSSLR